MSSEAFVRREVDGLPFYCCTALEELTFLRHGFSTRHGGVSPLPSRSLNLSFVSWDAPERVKENRRKFTHALELPDALVTLSQIHSDRVHIIEEKPGQRNPGAQGDALVTRSVGVPLAVQGADCFPILIVDPEAKTIAAVHAGWRGTLARIVVKTIGQMRERFGCDPARLLIAVGPGIRSCCFEVGPEVLQAFQREFAGVQLGETGPCGRFLLDLRKALEMQFEEAGGSSGRIYDLGKCTRCCADEFFSFRREGPRSGRLMGVIGLV
jgi:polyphenol oxidase